MLRDKLQRFSRQISPADAIQADSRTNHHLVSLAQVLDAEIFAGSGGEFLKIVTDFNETYLHGHATFKSYSELPRLSMGNFPFPDQPVDFDIGRLLFIDTETTGLGGSGTVPFLIGVGSMVESGFQVRQYFLPDYPDESAMLEAIRAEIHSDSIIVSYNGKAFDMPIISDRLIIHRIERNLEFGGHIDLLFHTRRLFRRRLQDCTLANVEREILGYFRNDDIPGFLVPSIYFDWLATGQTGELRHVMKHNLDDIVSLFFLLHHIIEIFERPEERLFEPDDILSFAKICESRRDNGAICRFLEKYEADLYNWRRYDILFLEALACKRVGNPHKAAEIWENIAGSNTALSYFAHIELAKYYEHRIRDITAAMKQAEKAVPICPRNELHRTALKKRTERLNKKLSF